MALPPPPTGSTPKSTPKSTVADLLAKTDLFGTLDAANRELVASRMRPVTFKNGQAIFSRGDAARELYLVQSGRVRLSILTSEGREVSLAHATEGVVFGEIAVFDGGGRSADATAISQVAALSLTKPALASLMETTPSIAMAAISFLCRRLRETDHKIEAIALHPIEVRLARFLLSAVQLTSAQAKPGSRGAKVPLDLGMSQSELALLVGATRPKVNAALAQLEESEAITREGSRLMCDLDILKALAASD